MTCEEARIRMAEEIGRQTPGEELGRHLASCATCESEAAQIRNLWARLGDLPEPQPSPWISTRFYAALDAYQHGLRERERGWFPWWPARPAWQIAISACCLLIGLAGGTLLMQPREKSAELAQLRTEMAGMRQLVTLSLLQQQSAVERLRGVNFSYRAEPNDTEVLSALLETVASDPSPDVRLAAVDALRNFSDQSEARHGLADVLSRQSSPLVQIAIIDMLSELKDRRVAPALRQLAQAPDVDFNVRRRAETALKTFH